MAVSQVTISNAALAELREAPIQSLDEQSLQARESARAYASCLAEMLEAHEWGFAIRRTALATVTNDRPAEWLFAYALPAAVGTPIAVIPPQDGTVGWFVWWRQPCWRRSYVLEGGVIYSNVQNAVLCYGLQNVSPDLMTAMFRRALVLGMAERMAITFRDSATLQVSVGKRAEVAMQRAMADDMNRQPQGNIEPSVGAVRGGGPMTGVWPGSGFVGYPASTGY